MSVTVEMLGPDELEDVWRDRFGWRIWWHDGAWVSQADSGAGSDKPRTVEDMCSRGPFTADECPC